MDEHGEHRSAMEFGKGVNDQDMADAERELTKLMKETSVAGAETKSPSKVKGRPQRNAATRESDSAAEQAKRKGLMDQIARFAESAKPGEELKLSPELTSFDRRLVHEFATQLNIEHTSEGLDGVDRRITLTIPAKRKGVQPAMLANDTEMPLADDAAPLPESAKPSPFAALVDSDDDEAEDDDDDDDNVADSGRENDGAGENSVADGPPMNSLLGDLAKERQMRARAAQKATSKPPQPSPGGGGKKKGGKKKKGQKLGGTKKQTAKKDKSFDGLDDMAFLDAQIDRVQNSHGRKVEGKGSYKTIVNGILLSKPAPREKPKNGQASSALNAKLKAAQDGRRTKKGKKKK